MNAGAEPWLLSNTKSVVRERRCRVVIIIIIIIIPWDVVQQHWYDVRYDTDNHVLCDTIYIVVHCEEYKDDTNKNILFLSRRYIFFTQASIDIKMSNMTCNNNNLNLRLGVIPLALTFTYFIVLLQSFVPVKYGVFKLI